MKQYSNTVTPSARHAMRRSQKVGYAQDKPAHKTARRSAHVPAEKITASNQNVNIRLSWSSLATVPIRRHD